MMFSLQEKREQLAREYDDILERCRQEAEKAQRRLDAISAKLQRLDAAETRRTFAALVGRPGAVRVRYRQQEGERCAHLNDLRGTVLEVRRTRALVDFGTAGATKAGMSGKWEFPLDALLPTEGDRPQGELWNLGDATR